jgi:hypothetical protein
MVENPVLGAVIGLGTAAAGIVAGYVGSVMAAAGSGDLGPWAQVGGTATAVGALAYVAKLLADGKLVSQPIGELLRDAKVREDRLEHLIEDTRTHLNKVAEESKEREDAFRAFLIQRGGQQ